MRVIAGTARGIPLETIEEDTTRPTVDRVKESLFNILMPHLQEAQVCDFFSGSGSLCIEALSRGAQTAYFVEMNPKAMAVIKRNVKKTNLQDKARYFPGSYLDAILYFQRKNISFDVIFLDPPHASGFAKDVLERIKDLDICKDDGIIIVEHHTKQVYEEELHGFIRYRQKKYGNTTLSFYTRSNDESRLSR